MFIVEQSLPTCKEYTTSDSIHLFLQFYIDKDYTHREEIRFALQQNVNNPFIDTILLLNERIYTDEELGVTSPKIKQIVIGNRITYYDFLNYDIHGYKVLINADIFVDETIQNVRTSDIHLHKKMFALLRYEYNNGNPKLFCRTDKTTGREDSQDTWIIHSNHLFSKNELDIFKIQLGVPGCDNKITYLFRIIGFEIYNDPEYIKTYHCHATTKRIHTHLMTPPFCHIFPASIVSQHIDDAMAIYSFTKSNTDLYTMLQTNQPILIPRIAGVENNFVMTSDLAVSQQLMSVMKRNAGIQITSIHSIEQYKKWYLSAFEKCSVYAAWEPWGNVYKHISKSHDEIQRLYPKPVLWAYVFDIFHYIHKPWTHALANKRILIISAFAESIQKQQQAYPVDLFPNCTFVYLKPPQTNGSNTSLDWHIEFVQFCNKIKRLENEFDVALCSCGGYGNPVCSYIYSMNKTAIYVGGVLQMYFGIYGNRWLKERRECMKLYMTTDWKRPSEHEKPLNHSTIESGCYW